MLIPHLDVLISQIVTFAIGMGAVWVIYLKPLGLHLRSRRDGIAKDLAAAESARAEAEHLRGQLNAERKNMAEEMRKAKEDARADVARLREELLAKAQAEQSAMLKQAQAQIAAETQRAVAEVRSYAAELVVLATAKMVEKKLDGPTDRALAEKLVASVKASKN
jgi:F-type H+-transporting ATPase subunit b